MEEKDAATKKWIEDGPPETAPRWAHQIFAHAFGYFWIFCKKCGEKFGGHEWKLEDNSPGGAEHGHERDLFVLPFVCTQTGRVGAGVEG